MKILKVRYPDDYNNLVQAYYNSFANGRTEVEANAAGRAGMELF